MLANAAPVVISNSRINAADLTIRLDVVGHGNPGRVVCKHEPAEVIRRRQNPIVKELVRINGLVRCRDDAGYRIHLGSLRMHYSDDVIKDFHVVAGVRLIPSHFHELNLRPAHLLAGQRVRGHQPGEVFDRETPALVRGVFVDCEPLDVPPVTLPVAGKNVARHRCRDRITVLVHEQAVMV